VHCRSLGEVVEDIALRVTAADKHSPLESWCLEQLLDLPHLEDIWSSYNTLLQLYENLSGPTTEVDKLVVDMSLLFHLFVLENAIFVVF